MDSTDVTTKAKRIKNRLPFEKRGEYTTDDIEQLLLVDPRYFSI